MEHDMRLAMLAIVVVLISPGASQAPATLAGCVTGSLSQPVGAARITITDSHGVRRVPTDGQGCYRVDDLPPGTYTVRAAVPGYCDGIREKVSIRSGERVAVDFALVVAPVSERISYAWTGWPDVARRADAILYLRVQEVLATEAWPSTGCASDICEIRALVISAARAPQAANAAPGPIRFLWNPSYPRPESPPFRAGENFVAFLQWVPASGRLSLTDAGLMVPVRGGRVWWVVGNDRSADGRNVADFLAEMRALPGRFQQGTALPPLWHNRR
jgi:hypothetical protein